MISSRSAQHERSSRLPRLCIRLWASRRIARCTKVTLATATTSRASIASGLATSRSKRFRNYKENRQHIAVCFYFILNTPNTPNTPKASNVSNVSNTSNASNAPNVPNAPNAPNSPIPIYIIKEYLRPTKQLLKFLKNYFECKWLRIRVVCLNGVKIVEKSSENIWKLHFFAVTLHPLSGQKCW